MRHSAKSDTNLDDPSAIAATICDPLSVCDFALKQR
jgi:hypothetical protein